MLKRRKPIRRVSKKRARENAKYLMLRKAYLIEHPFCQIYIKRFGLDEAQIMKDNGVYKEVTPQGYVHWIHVPVATEIHHTRKPKQTYLNDVGTWLSASRWMHEWVENNKNLARQMGLLHNI